MKRTHVIRLFSVLAVMALSWAVAVEPTYAAPPTVGLASEFEAFDSSFDYHEADYHDANYRETYGAAGRDSGCSCDAGCGSACRECLWCRKQLFGDWLGARSCLAQRGIVADLQLTQFYQGVSSGGVEQTDAYGGKLDYQFTFLGEPLGLNKGFTAILHAETRYGQDANAAAGALGFPNANMLWPSADDVTSISGLIVMQALSERVVLAGGKFNGLDLFNMIYPHSGRGIDGFMNLKLLMPPTLLRTTGLSINAAGVLLMKEKQIQSAVLVYDTQGSSTTVAPDLFDRGVVILGYHRFFTEYCGMPGSHAFLSNYSNRTYASTDPSDWTDLPGEGLTAAPQTGSWTLTYFLDQIVWADGCNENRNVRLFSFCSIADRNPSPYGWSGNVMLKASGMVCSRPADTMGAAYFYGGLNSDFKTLVSASPNFDIEDIHGIELYYNAEITPWFHLTGDLQVIDNQNVADDPAVVLGLRAKLDL